MERKTCSSWLPESMSAFKIATFNPPSPVKPIFYTYFSQDISYWCVSSAILLSCWPSHVFVLPHICPESPSVFEDTPPSFANVQCLQGAKFWVQSRAVQLYLLNLQLALEIKFRMQGELALSLQWQWWLDAWCPWVLLCTTNRNISSLPGGHWGETTKLWVCNMRIFFVVCRERVQIKPTISLWTNLTFSVSIVFGKKNKDDCNWIILCPFKVANVCTWL